MNGVHDLGGLQGFGPVEREEDEPAFHARWEAIVWAINSAARRGQGIYNLDEFRHAIERMEPAHYLASGYYEHWLDGITRILIEKGVVDPDELEARAERFAEQPDEAAEPVEAASRASDDAPVRAPFNRQDPTSREATAPPRFAVGDQVRTRMMNPRGHTRLPRYARGKQGVIHRVHGVHVFPDTNAHGEGEQPQYVYSVRFTARELWGESAEPNQLVHLDAFEPYLLPA